MTPTSKAAQAMTAVDYAKAENIALHCAEAHILAGNAVCSSLMQKAAETIRALLAAQPSQAQAAEAVAWTSADRLESLKRGEGRARTMWDAVLASSDDVPLYTAPPASPVASEREAVRDAIAEALGEAYDCTRVWSAWGYATMSSDDFQLVAEDDARLDEITDAAIRALSQTPAPGGE